MAENYFEMQIRNIRNAEIKESERNTFFDSFDAIKKESFEALKVIIRNVEFPEMAKIILDLKNFPLVNFEKIIYFLKHPDYISSSDEVLDWMTHLNLESFHDILYLIKPIFLGNDEACNKIRFPLYHYPIIRIMDYCLKHSFFEKFSICTERLEDWVLEAYCNVRKNLIEECINNNRNNPEMFFLFNHQNSSIVRKCIGEEDIPNLTYPTCKMLISQNLLPGELINCSSFFDVFKKFSLPEQIAITELLEGYDYPTELIDLLHKLFNKEKVDNIDNNERYFNIHNILEISPDFFEKIRNEIISSSYFRKFNVEKDEFWQFINSIFSKSKELECSKALTEGSYYKLRELYRKCSRYATESIVSSLYPLSDLTQRVTYMDKDEYNILCRVQTLYDLPDLDESFNKRTFCDFSILTQDNFSHYPGAILHGYYSKVTADLIAHIYPTDSLSSSWAKYQKDLSQKPNMLLDIDDLNALAYAYKTYCELCIRTKTRNNEVLKSDAIICFDDVDDRSIRYAEKHNERILVLKRTKKTIECNEDIYSHLQ